MKLERDVLNELPLYRSYISQPVVFPFQFLLRHSLEEGFVRP